jgi:Transposase DDE domain
MSKSRCFFGVSCHFFIENKKVLNPMFATYSASLRPYSIFGHQKTNERFVKTITTLGENFGKSIPISASNKREKESIYHFMNSPLVTAENILLAERDRVLKEINDNQTSSTFFAIGDVTVLSFTTTNRGSAKMGLVGGKNHPGYNVLSQLMCDSNGVSIGLLSQNYWNYEASELGQRKSRQHLPIDQKETGYYFDQFQELESLFKDQPKSRIVFIFDRAGDVHEILQGRQSAHIHFLIRSKSNRKLQDTDLTIRAFLDQVEPCGCYSLEIQASKIKNPNFLEAKKQKKQVHGEADRIANLTVKYSKITIRASNIRANRPLKPVELYVVRAEELNPPEGVEPIDWILLTSLPVENFEDALQIIQYYGHRWQIEVFHNILKQGAQIEKLQFEDPVSTQNSIAIYSLISAQILLLRAAFNKSPEANIEQFGYSKNDYKIIATYLNARNKLTLNLNKETINISEFTHLISTLGGNHSRESIGAKSLWQGIKDFRILKDAYNIFYKPPD